MKELDKISVELSDLINEYLHKQKVDFTNIEFDLIKVCYKLSSKRPEQFANIQINLKQSENK